MNETEHVTLDRAVGRIEGAMSVAVSSFHETLNTHAANDAVQFKELKELLSERTNRTHTTVVAIAGPVIAVLVSALIVHLHLV